MFQGLVVLLKLSRALVCLGFTLFDWNTTFIFSKIVLSADFLCTVEAEKSLVSPRTSVIFDKPVVNYK